MIKLIWSSVTKVAIHTYGGNYTTYSLLTFTRPTLIGLQNVISVNDEPIRSESRSRLMVYFKVLNDDSVICLKTVWQNVLC